MDLDDSDGAGRAAKGNPSGGGGKMSKVIIEDCGGFAVVRLNGGVTNAISPALVSDMTDAIKHVTENFQGLVLAGGSKFFCIGFDLPELLKLDRTGMTDFLSDFEKLTFDIFTAPMPTVCAMAGHAVGGGNILALTCDFRYSSVEKRLIGLNEVKLGLPVPYLADLILRQLVGDRAANTILYHGELMAMSDARQIGLIDEIVPPETLEKAAMEKITGLISLPRSGFSAIKANRVEAIRVRFQQNQAVKREVFIDNWFSEPIQNLLGEASKKF